MQLPRLRTADGAVLLCLVSSAFGAKFDCSKITVDKETFDLSKLGGPHSVVTTIQEDPGRFNTTYTLDICKNLVKKGDACPEGTRVCAIRHTINEGEGAGHGDVIGKIIPIAGDLEDKGGHALEFETKRIEPSEDAKEPGGFRLTLTGGAYPPEAPKEDRKTQKAVVDFVCNKDKTGLESEWPTEDKYEGQGGGLGRREGAGDGKEGGDGGKKAGSKETQLIKDGAPLKFVSYGPEKGEPGLEVLRLRWETSHACAGTLGDPVGDGDSSSHWGFFTWLVIIVFLGVAAYLIFGSWLNYNRYGARGWDLLPHGDTIRDVPYLMKDWTRRVLNTVQGSGSRGGYSAVQAPVRRRAGAVPVKPPEGREHEYLVNPDWVSNSDE